MTVREYIGARYVPLFIGEWNIENTYEPLSIVTYQGDSYTSRQYVPANIPITNETYWAVTGNYNAQIEGYRQEVRAYDARITANADAIADEVTARENAIEHEEIARNEAIENALDDNIGPIEDRLDAIEAPNWVTSWRIADESIGGNKLVDDAIGEAKIANGVVSFQKLDSYTQELILNRSGQDINVVFIGDSYGRGVYGTDDKGWPYYTAQALNTSNFINVSNSGAGFVATGHSEGLEYLNFEGQVQYARENLPSTMNAARVDYVIIAGGYNDHGRDGIANAVYSCVRLAKTLFDNAKVIVLPLCVGDRVLTSEFNSCYHNIIEGAMKAGAATTEDSIYWLYPYQLQTSSGDQIHPNDAGYQKQGYNIATFVLGGNVSAYANVYGSSAEGFSISDGASVSGAFRCGVNNNTAWMSGAFTRTGTGNLCVLPSYLRPNNTVYFFAFYYANSSHHGVGRMRVTSDGTVNLVQGETATIDNSLSYTIYIPYMAIALGHTWV